MPAAAAALAAGALASASIGGGQGVEVLVIDFEGMAEGTAIGGQYAGIGVTFSTEGSPMAPIICTEGSPRTAFSGGGLDAPMSSGANGLTDPIIKGDELVPADIRIHFDPPVTSVRFYTIDMEGGETLVATAFDGERTVASHTVNGGEQGTGNGVSTLVFLQAPSITSVLLDIDGPATNTGWAIDYLVLTRPCQTAGCAFRMRVSQESAPGAGDFGANILGEVVVWDAPNTSAAEFYAYDVPEGESWNGAALAPEADTTHLLAAVTSQGATLFLVHDRAVPNDPNGGRAETRVEILGDPDGADFAVQDDPPDDEGALAYPLGGPGEIVFAARHDWAPCCTDGYAIGGLDCGASALVSFTDVDGTPSTPTVQGLTDWIVVGADGALIPLSLEVDRRVRLDLLPPGNCPADLSCDGTVDGNDLGILLGAWDAPGGAADLDGSGLVDGSDLGELLGYWGSCR